MKCVYKGVAGYISHWWMPAKVESQNTMPLAEVIAVQILHGLRISTTSP